MTNVHQWRCRQQPERGYAVTFCAPLFDDICDWIVIQTACHHAAQLAMRWTGYTKILVRPRQHTVDTYIKHALLFYIAPETPTCHPIYTVRSPQLTTRARACALGADIISRSLPRDARCRAHGRDCHVIGDTTSTPRELNAHPTTHSPPSRSCTRVQSPPRIAPSALAARVGTDATRVHKEAPRRRLRFARASDL